MANQKHLDILKQGVEVWNRWRKEHAAIDPDLTEADLTEVQLSLIDPHFKWIGVNLSHANLTGADLSHSHLTLADLSNVNLSGAYLSGAYLVIANLTGANLSQADLMNAHLGGANLTGANLMGAYLMDAILSGADLRGTDLREVYLGRANLSDANLSKADLSGATLIRTNLSRAILVDCSIHGISIWNVQLEGAKQNNLVITPNDEPTITVDNLEVAQFIYLLLNNQKIREVIDTITSKVVLILGRFTVERGMVLDALKEKLREHNYTPVLFDFDKPASQTMMETINTLAHLARFIIVDITDPRSVPAELATIVPHCLVPVQPLLEVSAVLVEENVTGKHAIEERAVKGKEYTLFRSLQSYPWVLPIFRYQDTVELLTYLNERVIGPAEQKVQELAQQK